MTDDEIRIKLAEFEGLNPITCPFVPSLIVGEWFSPDAAKEWFKVHPNSKMIKIIPDYLNDLNAVHGLLAKQSTDFKALFEERLYHMAASANKFITDLTAKDWSLCAIDVIDEVERKEPNAK